MRLDQAPYFTKLSRTYKDSAGKLHSSNSFSGSDLLVLAKLADIAHTQAILHGREATKAATAAAAAAAAGAGGVETAEQIEADTAEMIPPTE
ncbi:hypothetical protein ACOBR2_18420 [Telmatobacter bradus]|uniref:hypothetical protein n=1 Tax=Telmatobacter bradus TaxID=474953 RepID=UPI003B4392C4